MMVSSMKNLANKSMNAQFNINIHKLTVINAKKKLN